MTTKFEKLNTMAKYLVMVLFLSVAMTLMGVGVNVFVSILGGFVVVAAGYMLCVFSIHLETSRMRKLNEQMNASKSMDGYNEAMEKIGKRTIWMTVYHQTLLNRGTGYVNQGEYKKALEVMDELEKYTVSVQIRFLEIWNRLFALIELKNYGQAERTMKKYQKLLAPYEEASESIADRLEIYRYLTAGDTEMALEKIEESRAKCKENEQDVIDQLDFYELRLRQLTGEHERVEELKSRLRSHKVFPCIAKAL